MVTPLSQTTLPSAILQTIAIAKTHSDSKIKVESSFSNNEAIPLLSYLWVVRDYLMNGFYVNREKVIKKNQRGKVDWNRTLGGQPIISKGNVVYSDLVPSQQKWTQKSFKKRNESQYFVHLLKTTACIPQFA